MKKIFLLILIAFSFVVGVKAQQLDVNAAKQLVIKNSAAIGMSATDLQNFRVSNAYTNEGAQMVYLLQDYKGLPVFNQMRVLQFKGGELTSNAGAFLPNLDKASNNGSATPAVNAVAAVKNAFQEAGITTAPVIVKAPVSGENGRKLNFGKLSGVTEDVKAELFWVPVEDGKQTNIKLAWTIQVVPAGSDDYWLIQVDAVSGKIINKLNLSVKDSWEKNSPGLLRARPLTSNIPLPGSGLLAPFQHSAEIPNSPNLVNNASYLVIPYPAASPQISAATVVNNPWTHTPGNATPFNWHSEGATDYNITRGNNVWATEDHAAANQNTGQPATSSTSPDPLNFNFPPDYTLTPSTGSNLNFAITNLFYWNNNMHDMSYQYGFNEVSANFQTNNNGQGGAQNDNVKALCQSGAGTNNANFATPADGQRGQMRMYLFDPVASTVLHVNAPAALVGNYTAVEGNMSTANLLQNVGPVTAPVVYYPDATGGLHQACTGIAAGALTGKIALIDRGTCNFTVKVHDAQDAGAVAVIMVNNVPGAPIIMGGGPDNTIVIPAVMVSDVDGATLATAAGTTLNVTLSGSAGVQLDGDLDGTVMCHEYGHGITHRLTGGGTSTCNNNAETGDEGWSDYEALMLTTNWATATVSDGPLARPIGTYVEGQPINGPGIRNYPYSTNIAINPLTYANVGTGVIGTEVHNIGEVWCMAIWEMTWSIIQQQNSINTNMWSFNVATTTGGNSIAYKLVLEGERLQACSPGFIDARDGILKADRNLYCGAHACAIWTAFAKRGMGFGSLQGNSNVATDQTSTTTMPPAPTITTQPQPVTVAAGANAVFTASAGTDINLIYQWQVSTDGGTTWTDISCQISSTLTLTAVTTTMNGYKYRCRVYEACLSTLTTATGALLTVTGSANPAITLTSAASTTSQTLCINTAITNIVYATSNGVTGATVTGLPTGVTGVYSGGSNGTFTINGTPTVAGPFSYTITTSGGTPVATASGTITVNANVTMVLTSAAGTTSQTVCTGAAITNIVYSTGSGATGATVTGLPTGVTGAYSGGTNGTVTISGTPTVTGVFNYTVITSGGCGTVTLTGTITVNAGGTITLTSAAGTTNQTVTAGTPITTITYSTANGVTGATVTGLPTGVTGVYSGGTNGSFTISGTPTLTGTFNYTVSTTGGCGTATLSGTITVTPAVGPSITLTSAAGTSTQTVCVNTAITTITYSTGSGVTNATVAGLPTGVTGTYSGGTNGTFTISGTPTATGTFNYTVTTSGGGPAATATGTIIVRPNATITLTSAAGTNNQTVFANNPITNITYTITGGVTGATVTGLPAGVTGTFAGTTLTISGTPTATGTFNYTVTPVGGCGAATATGTITVNAGSSITLTSAASSTSQTVCVNTAITNITYSTAGGVTGAAVTGLPAGVTGTYSGGTNGTVTISGTPTAAGTFSYTVTTAGGSGPVTATGTIVVSPNATVTLSSAAGTNNQSVCVNTAITNITYTTGNGATGATVTGLPAGITGTYAAGVFTISGTATGAGTFNYTVTATGGCSSPTATGTIIVKPATTITLTSAANTNNQTVCINTAVTNITYTISAGATGATVTGLPAGVTGTYAAGVFTISGTPTVSGTFNYTVTTTGGCGIATATGTITTGGAPTITAQPVGITSCATTATFSVTATGAGLTYQWQVSTDNGATYTNIAGQTGSTITLTGLTPAQSTNMYRVIVTGVCGSVTSNAVSAHVGVTPVVILSAAPTTAYNPAHNGGLFTTVSPAGNYNYQWTRDGVVLPINAPQITAANGLLYDFGTYVVTVTDATSGCAGVSNAVTIIDVPGERGHLFISPNPTNGPVTVSFYSSTTTSEVRGITVYDDKGSKIMTKDFTIAGRYATMTIDLTSKPAGTYMIILRDASGKNIADGKVVKF